MAATALSGPFVVDAHVHLHRLFHLETFLEAAAANVARAARFATPGRRAIGVLLLSEGKNEDAFSRLQTAAPGGTWSFHRTQESESLLIRRSDEPVLIAIAGRQLETREGVEVLELLSGAPFREPESLVDTVARVRESGAIPVLPWGFGKWAGRRGALVASLLYGGDRPIFAGDNGGRLRIARLPSLLAEARERAVPILPGSDPLPFRDHQTRAGSYALLADVSIDAGRPAAAIRSWLGGLNRQPPICGELASPGRFVWNQVRMQWHKRVRAHR